MAFPLDSCKRTFKELLSYKKHLDLDLTDTSGAKLCFKSVHKGFQTTLAGDKVDDLSRNGTKLFTHIFVM